jgi:penicillin-binding protein 1A
VIAAGLGAIAALADGAVHHSASASDLPLAPLNTATVDGSTVYAADGHTVLAVLRGPKKQVSVRLSQVSLTVVAAVLATEDHDFYIHGGFDIPSIVRAFVHNASGSGLQGGSTIAQQLVKMQYLDSGRNLTRKIREAVLADRLERKYSKNQILQAYLNTIYLGNGSYGVEAAAETYFREPARRLNLPQAALLAGMIQDPNGYDPLSEPKAARDRRAEVLDRMVVYHDITPAQAAEANATALPTAVPVPASDPVTNYYVEHVKNELLAPGSPLGRTYADRYDALFNGSLHIYTDMDPHLQALAERTVRSDTPANSGGFQQALISVDPTTGKVRALVGGSGTTTSKFDIVTQGTRQPGSGFKLFTLVAALERGYTINDSVLGKSPCAVNFPTDPDLLAHPANNDEGNGGGVMTVLNATAQSTNCAFIRLAHETGLSSVIATAHQLGITAQLPPYPSIVIGSIAVHPIEMAGAYAALADGGVYHKPTFIDRIVDGRGRTIYAGASPGRQVVPSPVAAEANLAFQAVVQSGTGTAAALPGRPVAGKTGTTNGNVDAWFNGFTPQLETTVWMGNPNAEVPMSDVGGIAVYGGTYPARTWHDFMGAALAGQPVAGFAPPPVLAPGRCITSPALVADDVLDHNQPCWPAPNPLHQPPATGRTGPGFTGRPGRKHH